MFGLVLSWTGVASASELDDPEGPALELTEASALDSRERVLLPPPSAPVAARLQPHPAAARSRALDLPGRLRAPSPAGFSAGALAAPPPSSGQPGQPGQPGGATQPAPVPSGATIPVRPGAATTTPAAPTETEGETEGEAEATLAAEGEAEFELETPTLQRKRTVPPFWLEREYDTHTTKALTFPPLFVHRQPKDGHPEKLFHADLSFTFAYYNKERGKKRWMNPLGLYFGGFSEHKTVWAALPLLMGYRRVGEEFNFGQFPLVWWWGNKYVKNLFVFPLHYQTKEPDRFFGMSALLFWYGNSKLNDDLVDNDRRHFVAAPVFFRFKKGLRTLDVSPLYFGGRNEGTGVTHRTVLPLFHWQSREFGNRKELWTIPWIRRTDAARERSAWAIPPLLTFRTQDRDASLTMVTPLVWGHHDKLVDRKTWASPLVGHIRDPNQRVTWAAPLWLRFADLRNDASLNILAPLAMWRRSPERTAVHTLAFSMWRDRGPDGTPRGGGGGSLPLLTWVHHSPERSRQLVAAGLFWRDANFETPGAERSAWGVGPLVYRSTLGDARATDGSGYARFGAPPLLTFAGRKGTRSYQVVTPMFWHVRDESEDPERQHDTWVVPPLYVQRRAQGFRAGLVPLFVAANDDRQRYTVIPPLLFGHVEDKQAQTSRTVWPLFVRTKTPDSQTIGAGLLAWDVRRELTLDGQSVRHRDSALFPLYYRRQRGDSTLHLSPLGGAKRGPDGNGWVGLLAYGFNNQGAEAGKRGGGLAPLFHHEVRLDGAGQRTGSTDVLFPLYVRDRRPERDLDIWTPLIWRGRIRGDKPRNTLAIAPLYFGQRQPGGVDIDASLVVFYSRDRTRRTHTLVAGPYYHRLTRDKLISGLGPLAYWEDSEKRRLLVVPPLIVSLEDKEARERTTVALPLWFDRVRPSGGRTWMAFPFVVGVHGNHDFVKAGIAFPLFYDIHRLRKNYRFTGVVPLLFRYQKGGFQAQDLPEKRYTLWGSFPLFFYGKDGRPAGEGRRTHSALALYWFDRQRGGEEPGFKFYTLLGGVAHKPGKELAWYAPLVYRKVTNEQATTFLWPIIAYHKGYRKGPDGKPYKDISTTWVLPPLYISRHREDRSWWQSTLLVWQFKRPHQVSTAVLPPLFFLRDAYKERRLHWLLPLYLRDNNMAKGEKWTAVIPGLFVQHRNKKHNNAVQFPLVWHFANDKRRVTVGMPLWYDVRNPNKETETQLVPALYARRATPEKVGHLIGPGLASWRREAEGQPPQLHWRALFWIVGGGNEDGERYLWLFGGKIKLKPKALKPKRSKERKRRKRKRKGEAEVEAGAGAETGANAKP